MKDLVSIIVPVYNASETIQRCIVSLKKQSYKEIQVILVNDGSKDDSLQICTELTKEDPRFIIIDKENGGVSSARNCGIENALGKYILFLDSDDWLENDMINRYIYLINTYNVDVIIGSLNGISNNNQETFVKTVPVVGKQGNNIWNIMCDSSEIFGYIGGKMFKKCIVDKNCLRFNEKMYAQEDLDFCLSYYGLIDKFYLTEYAGYKYYYVKGKRKPPYCDFMRNQLKLLEFAKKKCELNGNAYYKIQERICGYVYIMLYETKSYSDLCSTFDKMNKVGGLKSYLHNCKIKGEKKHIISWYLKDKRKIVFFYFKCRDAIKQILKREW